MKSASRQTIGKVYNALGFLSVWMFCLFAGANGLNAFAIIASGMFCITHILFFSEHPKKEACIMLVITVFGTLYDSTYKAVDVLRYQSQYGSLPPLWVTAMWLAFSCAMFHTFGWLKKRYILAAVCGIVVMPCIYFYAQTIGAVIFFVTPVLAWVVLATGWGIALPASYWIAERVFESTLFSDE